MKKVVAGILVVAVCGAIAWGYLALKGAILQPAPLVERDLGPYCVAFGPELGAAERKQAKKEDAAAVRLASAGIHVEATSFSWIMAGGHSRMGTAIHPSDAARARKLGGNLLVATLPAQRAWVFETPRHGTLSMAMSVPRGAMAIATKAGELKRNSYCMLIDMSSGAMTIGLLKPPE